MKSINVAILGLGTVGTGVAKILTEHPDRIASRAGSEVHIRRVLVRDKNRSRAIQLPTGVVTDNVDEIIDDPEIDIAIQLMGGLDPARPIMARLIQAGKHIVTANKALLCEHGDELFALAREHKRTIAFEAAVAGGVPIVATLGQSMSGNQITSIEAILNGTSNFILTSMLSEGRSYDDAVKAAQELGYAEADPTMDVDGTDAAQKLTLLTRLAFGTRVPLSAFPRQGIEELQLADLNYARELGYTIKLLAVARLVKGELELHVRPTLVRRDRPLAQIDGPFNMIALEGDAVGKTWLAGPGAGQMPTASAVVADLVDTVAGRTERTFTRLDLWNEANPFPVKSPEEVRGRFYLRFHAADRPHVFADFSDILGRNGISLASIIQHEAPEIDGEGDAASAHQTVPIVVMTHRTTEGQMRKADAELDQLDSLRGSRLRLPVAD